MKLTISLEQKESLMAALRDKGFIELAGHLRAAQIGVVDAPELGCMAVVLEQCCEIEVPAAEYALLESMSMAARQALLEILQQQLYLDHPELNLALVEFFNRG